MTGLKIAPDIAYINDILITNIERQKRIDADNIFIDSIMKNMSNTVESAEIMSKASDTTIESNLQSKTTDELIQIQLNMMSAGTKSILSNSDYIDTIGQIIKERIENTEKRTGRYITPEAAEHIDSTCTEISGNIEHIRKSKKESSTRIQNYYKNIISKFNVVLTTIAKAETIVNFVSSNVMHGVEYIYRCIFSPLYLYLKITAGIVVLLLFLKYLAAIIISFR